MLDFTGDAIMEMSNARTRGRPECGGRATAKQKYRM